MERGVRVIVEPLGIEKLITNSTWCFTLSTYVCFITNSPHKEPNFHSPAEINHAPEGYVYTMGILYRKLSTWPTRQLLCSSQRYVSTRPVRRLLYQEPVKAT